MCRTAGKILKRLKYTKPKHKHLSYEDGSEGYEMNEYTDNEDSEFSLKHDSNDLHDTFKSNGRLFTAKVDRFGMDKINQQSMFKVSPYAEGSCLLILWNNQI